MSSQYRLETDVNEAFAMAENLENYVRGNELYGHAGGGFFSKMPSLTVGALAMRLRRLQQLQEFLNDRQKKLLDEAITSHDEVSREWRVHYTAKAQKEMLSRLDAMATFFRECQESPRRCPSIYKPEASRRTIVQELVRLMAELGEETPEGFDDKVKGADNQLRSLVEAGAFIWAEDLQPVYPKDDFWWLYASPPKVEE